MATQRVILELVAQNKLSGLKGAERQMQALRSEVERLSAGTLSLTKTGQLWDTQQKRYANTAEANAVITAAVAREKQQLALTEQRVAGALGITTEQLRAQNSAAAGAAKAVGGLNHAVGSGQFAVISIGQAFQDMGQFGIGAAQGVRAVTNNVQQSVQAIVLMSAAAGGAKNAFNAMWAAAKGPIGALAAFSLATGLFELMSNRAQMAKKDVEEVSNALKDVIKIHREYSDTVDFSESQIVAAYDAHTESVERLRKKLAELRRQEAQAASFAGAGVAGQNLRGQIAESEEQLELAEKRAGALEEDAKAIRVRRDAMESARAETDASQQATARFEGALADLRTKIREAGEELEVSLTPEVIALRRQLEFMEGAVSAGLGFDEFKTLFQRVKGEMSEYGLASGVTAGKVAELWAEHGNLNGVLEAMLKLLRKKPERQQLTFLEKLQEAHKNLTDEIANRTGNPDEILYYVRVNAELERQRDYLQQIADILANPQELDPQGLMDPLGTRMSEFGTSRALGFLDGNAESNAQADDLGLGDSALRGAGEIADTFVDEAGIVRDSLQSMDQSFSDSLLGWLNNNAETITQTTQLMGQAIGSIGTNLMTLAKTGEETDMKLFAAGKAFAIGRAVINTAEGATKALAQGGIMGPVMAATVIAAGAAQIATIASARPGSRGIARSAGGSSSIPSAPNFVSGISNIGEIPSVGGAGIFGFPGQVTVGGTIHASGRELVTVISNEVAAQRRSGVRDPLGLGA